MLLGLPRGHSNEYTHYQYIKQNRFKLSQICSYWIFSKELKEEFETAMVNKPSVFKPLKFYCIWDHSRDGKTLFYG